MRLHIRTLLALLALGVAALVSASVAQAGIKQAESVLPPGQSGFVSLTGLPDGAGSPHLSDQVELFKAFKYKPALFGQQGATETPRSGVQIVRGPYGVPSITGATDFDAWWGVGYAVAQDRLFQLELFRRATSGRLAEILGDSFLADDLIARRDYYTDAELDQMLSRLPTNLVRRAEAYRTDMAVTAAEFDAQVEILVASLNHFDVPQAEQDELLALLAPMRDDIVEVESQETRTPLPDAYKPAPVSS